MIPRAFPPYTYFHSIFLTVFSAVISSYGMLISDLFYDTSSKAIFFSIKLPVFDEFLGTVF